MAMDRNNKIFWGTGVTLSILGIVSVPYNCKNYSPPPPLPKNVSGITNLKQGLVTKGEIGENKKSVIRHTFRPIPGESDLAREFFDLINSTMNPENCSTAKYLLCEWTMGSKWGLGSAIHQILTCFSAAVATSRVLQINAHNFSPRSWSTFLLSPSDTCANYPLTEAKNWINVESQENSSVTTLKIKLPAADMKMKSKYYDVLHPFHLPSIFSNISAEHQLPELWTVGQYVRYLIQPTKKLRHFIADVIKRIGFKSPIFGVHVRRGDKVVGRKKEADLTPLTRYMDYIDKIVFLRSNNTVKHKIYLATDDRTVFKKAREKYKNYTFIQLKADKLNRANYMVTLTDIFLLAECDYFVGTFSSSMGRLVHELRQQRYKDGSCMSKSVDVPEYIYKTCCNIGRLNSSEPLNCSYEEIYQQILRGSPIL